MKGLIFITCFTLFGLYFLPPISGGTAAGFLFLVWLYNK